MLFPSKYNNERRQFIYPKVDEIEQLYQPDGDCLRAVIECWMQGDGVDKQPSWRRIICALDCADEMRIADNIRHFAEPVSGKLHWCIHILVCESYLTLNEQH